MKKINTGIGPLIFLIISFAIAIGLQALGVLAILIALLIAFALLAYFFVYKPIVRMNQVGSELWKDFMGHDKGAY